MTDTRQGAAGDAKGHRWFAAMYDVVLRPGEKRLFSKVRPRLLGDLAGNVLEVGAGTGLNFPHYPPGVRVIATEPDPFMRERAERRASEQRQCGIEVGGGDAEHLPFEDASFDHVVATLIFCTVPDAPRGLREIRRVLKPGGSFRFLDHVRNDDSRFWGGIQDGINPVWRWFGAGCNLNRRTERAIIDSGFAFQWIERASTGFGVPAIYGVARPADS